MEQNSNDNYLRSCAIFECTTLRWFHKSFIKRSSIQNNGNSVVFLEKRETGCWDYRFAQDGKNIANLPSLNSFSKKEKELPLTLCNVSCPTNVLATKWPKKEWKKKRKKKKTTPKKMTEEKRTKGTLSLFHARHTDRTGWAEWIAKGRLVEKITVIRAMGRK